MKQLSNKYNKAIALIKEDRLEEAKWILESILASAPFHSESNWTAGLVEIMMGNPVAGLTYWERVSSERFPQLHERRDQVRSTLVVYEEIRAVYNQALIFVKENKMAEAEIVISPLFQSESSIPLPYDVCKLYFITLYENGKTEQALKWFEKAPGYIQTAQSFMLLIKSIRDESDDEHLVIEKEQVNGKAIKQKKKKPYQRVFLTASILAATIIGGTYVLNREWKTIPTVSGVSSTPEETSARTVVFEQKVADLETKLTTMESEKEHLKKELESELAKVSEYETTEDLYKKANLDINSLRSMEAREEFNNGYSLYKRSDFTGAKEKLDLSLQLDATQYFSDDSLYYFIQAEQQLGTLSGDSELFHQFFTSESEHFVDSPYQDDLLVIQAETYFREGKKEEALSILTKVQEQFPAEWTASYAKNLEKVIQEG